MEEKLRQYLTLLIFDFPFLMPAIKFDIINCDDAIAKTNGSIIFMNFKKIHVWSFENIYALLLHEILHCFLFHPSRLKNRDFEMWNAACDFVVNDIIVQISESYNKKLELPKGALYDPKYKNWSAEQVYSDLLKKVSAKKSGANSNIKRNGNSNKNDGTVNSDEAADKLSKGSGVSNGDLMSPESGFKEEDLKQEIVHAFKNNKKRMGNIAGVCDRTIEYLEKETVRWEKIFNIFVKRSLYYGNGRSFAKPKPYGWLYGVALPGNIGVQEIKVVVVIDTSGSVDEVQMRLFVTELKKIVSMHTRVHVVTCDCKVNEVVKINNIHDLLPNKKLKFTGGGGTNFAPALLAASKIQNDIVIYITDGIGKFGDKPRIKNLLWLLTKDTDVPFGKKVLMEVV